MRHKIAEVPAEADQFLPEAREDHSGIGVNYADVWLKALKTTLEDGRKVVARRRGLKITLSVGDRQGEGLLRRIEHGPDVREIVRHALAEAASGAGLRLAVDDGVVYLDEA
jgi:hypothetical protein